MRKSLEALHHYNHHHGTRLACYELASPKNPARGGMTGSSAFFWIDSEKKYVIDYSTSKAGGQKEKYSSMVTVGFL
jgi:hypothetical protein